MLLLLFHLMVWIYTFITFLPSYVLSWVSAPAGSFQGSEAERAKRAKAISSLGRPEGPYRAVKAAKRLMTSLHPGVYTLDKMFEYTAMRFPQRDCLGTREVISEEDERQSNGKMFKKVQSRMCFLPELSRALRNSEHRHHICPKLEPGVVRTIRNLQNLTFSPVTAELPH